MKALKHPGICKICGQMKELTAEHIPPKNAFNSTNVMVLPFEEVVKTMAGAEGRMPWDTKGLKGTVLQGGHKKYCLCRECNNNTGSWYMRAYTDFAKTVNAMIQQEGLTVGNSYSFVIKNLYPLRIYKAMMTLICDINNDCLGDKKLRQFLMDREDKNIDTSKYSLYMYFVSTQMPRISGLSGIVSVNNVKDSVLVSEMSSYPIGFALYLDKPANYTPFGINIDMFATFDYDAKCDLQFGGVPYLDINSQFPADYRSKDDIVKCVENTEKAMENRNE